MNKRKITAIENIIIAIGKIQDSDLDFYETNIIVSYLERAKENLY